MKGLADAGDRRRRIGARGFAQERAQSVGVGWTVGELRVGGRQPQFAGPAGDAPRNQDVLALFPEAWAACRSAGWEDRRYS